MRTWSGLSNLGMLAAALCAGCRLISATPVSAPELRPAVEEGQLIVNADFPLSASHRLIREVLAQRDDMTQLLHLGESEEKIHVRLFRDGNAYAQHMRKHYPEVPERRAFFVETDTRLEVFAHWSDRVAEDLRHEVAHGYLHAAVGDVPLWLDEGLAEYFEVPRGRQGLNEPHVELLADMIEHDAWRPNLEQLEALNHCAEMSQQHYAESWAWTHFLLQTEPVRRQLLFDYLASIRELGTAAPLSIRLAEQLHQPERTLVEYIFTLRDSRNDTQ